MRWEVESAQKVLHASEQERADVARARRRWIREQGLLDSSRLVFIDETSVNTNNSCEDLKLQPVPTSSLTLDMQHDRNPFLS